MKRILNKGRIIYVPLTVKDDETLKEQRNLIDLLCEAGWKYKGMHTLSDMKKKIKVAVLYREKNDTINSYRQKTLLEVTK